METIHTDSPYSAPPRKEPPIGNIRMSLDQALKDGKERMLLKADKVGSCDLGMENKCDNIL